jgi:cyclase
MLPKRIIARLDIKGEFLVKGIQLEGLRKIGDPLVFARDYYECGIDEVLIVDVVASLYSRKHLYDLISHITKKLRVPVTVVGGIKSMEDAREVFRAGADKIGINSEATRNFEFLSTLAEIYGAQAIVSSVEAKFQKDSQDWFLFTEAGRNNSEISIGEWFSKLNQIEIGEVLLTSVDRDGLRKGPDNSLIKIARESTSIPLIYGGGLSSHFDILETLEAGVDGISIGSALHYKVIEIQALKQHLSGHGIEVRIESKK